MASRQGEILLNTFLQAAGGEWRGVAMDDLLALLAAALEERAEAAGAAGTASRSTSRGRQQAPGSGSSAASKVLNTALGLVPVAKALMAIFGGDDEEEPATLVKFALPPALRIEAANSRAGVAGMDYGQEGLPRVVARRGDATTTAQPELSLTGELETFAGSAFDEPGGEQFGDRQFGERQFGERQFGERQFGERQFGDRQFGERQFGDRQFGDRQRISLRKFEASPRIAEAANITVQVQAMDSRSFLDHSAEIAQAVREAMLNMHSLNDVVNDI